MWCAHQLFHCSRIQSGFVQLYIDPSRLPSMMKKQSRESATELLHAFTFHSAHVSLVTDRHILFQCSPSLPGNLQTNWEQPHEPTRQKSEKQETRAKHKVIWKIWELTCSDLLRIRNPAFLNASTWITVSMVTAGYPHSAWRWGQAKKGTPQVTH